MTDLLKRCTSAEEEATSYHRFWIEERNKRIALESAMSDLVKALEAARDPIKFHGLSPYTLAVIDAALAKVKP